MCHLHSLGCTGKRKDPKVQSQRWKPELSPVKEAQLPHQTIQILECLNSAGNSHRHAREEELFGVRQLVMPSGRERFLPWTCHSVPPSEACAPLLPQGAVPIPAVPIPAVSQSHPLQTALSVYQTEDFILIHFMSVCCLATDSKALATNHCHPLDHHSLNFHPLEEKGIKILEISGFLFTAGAFRKGAFPLAINQLQQVVPGGSGCSSCCMALSNPETTL